MDFLLPLTLMDNTLVIQKVSSFTLINHLLVLFKETRDGRAVAQTDCLFYGLHKDDLEKLIEQHDDMKKIIYE